MNEPLKIAAALLIVGSLAACTTPVGVRKVDHGSVRQVLTEQLRTGCDL